METVSESFKKAIKSDTREIKGYVEVIYNDKSTDNYELSIAPNNIRFSLADEIVDQTRKCNKYASLEEDYTKLDGSFFLPNYNIRGEKAGYISENIFNEIETPTIKISCKDSNYIKSSGITIYFVDNLAQKFTITIITADDITQIINVEENNKSIYQTIFTDELIIKSIQMDIQQMEYSNRRIRISEIDLGISQIYEDGDLVSFNTIEEIDLMLTSTPINDCKVILNNYDNLFDPLNPDGLVKYLNDNCIMQPFIGVLTEENGIEYVKMGCFYLKDWSSGTDGNVTLNGQNLMAVLSKLDLKSTDGSLCKSGFYDWMFADFLERMYGYKFNLSMGVIPRFLYIKKIKLLDSLLLMASSGLKKNQPLKLFISRSNVFSIDNLNLNVVEEISMKQLIEKPKVELASNVNKISSVLTKYNPISVLSNREDALNQTYTLTETEEYVWFSFAKRFSNIDPKFSYTNTGNGTAELIDQSTNLAYVKFTGNIGDKITVHLDLYLVDEPSKINVTFTSEQELGETLELDYTDYFELDNNQIKQVAEYYLSQKEKYKIKSQYIGDPSLTPGDTITVETKFGNKDVILTKSSLTYDGGLSGSFEGMSD